MTRKITKAQRPPPADGTLRVTVRGRSIEMSVSGKSGTEIAQATAEALNALLGDES